MRNVVVAVAVLVPVAAFCAVWLAHVAASPPASWSRLELRYAAAGTVLTVPAAAALGAVHGAAEGVGALFLWGLLAGACYGAARIDRSELDRDTMWLFDVACLAFLGVTVFFSFVDFGHVFLPSAWCLVVAWRLAHLRRRRRDLRHAGS